MSDYDKDLLIESLRQTIKEKERENDILEDKMIAMQYEVNEMKKQLLSYQQLSYAKGVEIARKEELIRQLSAKISQYKKLAMNKHFS